MMIPTRVPCLARLPADLVRDLRQHALDVYRVEPPRRNEPAPTVEDWCLGDGPVGLLRLTGDLKPAGLVVACAVVDVMPESRLAYLRPHGWVRLGRPCTDPGAEPLLALLRRAETWCLTLDAKLEDRARRTRSTTTDGPS